jgi:hypothetical protein
MNSKININFRLKIPQIIIGLIFGGGVLFMIAYFPYVLAAVYSCNTQCGAVSVLPNSSVEVNLTLQVAEVEVILEETTVGNEDQKKIINPIGITANDIYLQTPGGNKIFCENAPDTAGKCVIKEIPTGPRYNLIVEPWSADLEYLNLPYSRAVDINNQRQSFSVVLLRTNQCEVEAGTPPPAYCSGEILREPAYCDPNTEIWIYSDARDCRISQKRICPDGLATILDGYCQNDLSGAVCAQSSCDGYQICSFSTPTPSDLERNYFLPGDKLEITGSNFGVAGGEVRIGSSRIFIDQEETRPDFSWSNNLITLILPYTVSSGEIGVRPHGYDYHKVLTATGWEYAVEQDPATGQSFKIPIYCRGGSVNVAEFSLLEVDGVAEHSVSVSGERSLAIE